MNAAALPVLALLVGASVLAGSFTGAAPPAAPLTGAWPPSPSAPPFPPQGTYRWPLHGPVLRPFEPPAGPFGAGHRGIDVGAPVGTRVHASESGVVAFAGTLAGSLFVSIDHPGGVRTTYSWLSEVGVRRGDRVLRGAAIGRSGAGHGGGGPPHLHFGALVAGSYIDPMLLLEPPLSGGLVRLAPLEPGDA